MSRQKSTDKNQQTKHNKTTRQKKKTQTRNTRDLVGDQIDANSYVQCNYDIIMQTSPK